MNNSYYDFLRGNSYASTKKRIDRSSHPNYEVIPGVEVGLYYKERIRKGLSLR